MPIPDDIRLIRRATPDDASALAVFAAEVFPLGCPGTAPSDLDAYISAELTPARFLALMADPNIVVLVAEADERIIAYMVIARRSPHPGIPASHPAEFRKLYVAPAYHGSGAAAALMHSALAILNAEGPRSIWLSTFHQNARAIAFYKKFGFEIVGEQIFLVGTDPQKDVLMQREAEAAILAKL